LREAQVLDKRRASANGSAPTDSPDVSPKKEAEREIVVAFKKAIDGVDADAVDKLAAHLDKNPRLLRRPISLAVGARQPALLESCELFERRSRPTRDSGQGRLADRDGEPGLPPEQHVEPG
jgi:hypothetical protein